MPIRKDWLQQTIEEPLDAERPLVDPHHHLWDFPTSTYLCNDLIEDMAHHNVRQTVFVECGAEYSLDKPAAMQPVGETAFVQSQSDTAAGDAHIAAAITGFADLQLGEKVAEVLDAHLAASPQQFRGIRHSCTWHASEDINNSHSNPPAQLYLQEDFHAGMSQLEQRGLLFEAWCYHTQIDEFTQLVKHFPAVIFILDHIGGPLGIGPYAGKRSEVFANWQNSIRALSACDNVHVKLGGIAMPLNGFNWHKQAAPPGSDALSAAFSPYFDFCITQFGPERCLFESNFPVDKVSCSYTVLWNAFKKIAAKYEANAQNAMLHDNAVRLYRLSS